jgi:hypothetical protein
MKDIGYHRTKTHSAFWRTSPFLVPCFLILGAVIGLLTATPSGQPELVANASELPSIAEPVTITPSVRIPTLEGSEGLVLRGIVAYNAGRNGHVVPGVKIYLQRAGSVPEVVAVTNEDGGYVSGFIPIPVGEKVLVWAESGTKSTDIRECSFAPREISWRRFTDKEDRTINFAALDSATPTRTPLPEGIQISGHVYDKAWLGKGKPVNIMMSTGSLPENVVAVTDGTGYYQSLFLPVQVGDTVKIWAETCDLTIGPEHYTWVYEGGTEQNTLDFTVQSALFTPTADPETTVEGTIWYGGDTFNIYQGTQWELQDGCYEGRLVDFFGGGIPVPTSLPEPGIVLWGRVSDRLWPVEMGVPGAKIYVTVGSTRAELVATTDPQGYFVSKFVSLEGDADVRVWAAHAAYSFASGEAHWYHKAGTSESVPLILAFVAPTTSAPDP